MRRLVLAACLGLTACGASTRVTREASTTTQVEQSGALSLLVLERPLGDTVALSLWIDVGTMDAPNASHALMAAQVLSSRLGLEMRVTPDATSFRQLCVRGELDVCLDRFGEVLRARDVSEEEFAQALIAVRQRREHGLADARRASLGLALEGVLGRAIHPLGDADDEVTREGVTRFLAAHYGPNRALVIAVGEDDRDALRSAAMRLDGPSADATRAALEEGAATLHAFDESHLPPSWSFAVRAETERDARAMAGAWLARGGEEESVSVFPTRLGWVSTLSTSSNEPAALLRMATWMRARDFRVQASVESDAWTLSNQHGDAWAARDDRARTLRVSFAGAGQVDVSIAERVDALLAARTSAVARDENLVRVTLDGSVLSVVDSLGGETASVELRFAGAASDGPTTGASAIALEALRARCFEDASVTLDGGSLRVLFHAALEALAERAALALDCVAAYAPSPDALDHARRSRIAHATIDSERRAVVARLLSPEAPGWILPEGARTSLSDVPNEDVEARLLAWRTSRDVVIGWPTQLEESETRALALQVIPPRMDPAMPTLEAPRTSPAAAEETRVHADIGDAEIIVAVRVDGADQPGSGEGACASLDAWSHANAARPHWRARGEVLGWSWCAIALRAWPEGAAPSVDAGALRAAMDAAHVRGSQARDLARADVAMAARVVVERSRTASDSTLNATFRRAIVEPAQPPLRRR